MLAKKYKSKLIAIVNPFEDIYTLEFESLGRQYKYHPGQFLHIALDKDYDGVGQWPESRCFSMQSNPDEQTIRITYAVKGSFTSKMAKNLTIGDDVWLKLPYGDLFQQPFNKENAVFIAGGTGVTPFLSLFTHSSFEEYTNPGIYLGFRSKKYNIYENELNKITNTGKLVHYVYQDKDGLLDIQKILQDNSIQSTYFISGPPQMIKSFKQTLINNKVAETNIITDDWE